MSEEEKKVVEKIKTLIQYFNVWKENFTLVPDDVNYFVTILNIIDRQSKEIEELTEGLKYRVNYCKLLEKELYENEINYNMELTKIEEKYLKELLEKE